MDAEGWYRDPYGVHDDRWFSAGRPTDLVRDSSVESRDDPPAGAPPTPLVEVPERAAGGANPFRRADELEAVDQSVSGSSIARQVINDATAYGWNFN